MKAGLRLLFSKIFRVVIFFLMAVQLANADAILTHRYSFDTDATDVVGGANGSLQGNAAVTNGGVFIGANDGVGLPENLFTNYGSITFEMWFVDLNYPYLNPGPMTPRPFSAGYLYNFSGPQGGMNFAVINNNVSAGVWSQSGLSKTIPVPWITPGRTNHVVWTQDSSSNRACVYLNGTLVNQLASFTYTPHNIGATTINELGNIRPGATNNLYGEILEFRTYQGALSSLEVAQSDAAGPDQLESNPGGIQNLTVMNPSPIGPGAKIPAVVYADFANLTNVNISSQPGLVLLSDKTNVVAITSSNLLRTVGLGTAHVTAMYQGFSNTITVTVSVPQDVSLLHRYSFNEPTNTWVAFDSVSGANGRVFGPFTTKAGGSSDPVPWAAFTGQGSLIMQTDPLAFQNGGAYVALPPGILSSLSEVSIETWLTWTVGQASPTTSARTNWEMVFDFGSSSGGQGNSYMFLTPQTDSSNKTTNNVMRSSITTNLNIAETPLLDWTNPCPANAKVLLTVTYSPVRKIAKLYLNGNLCKAGTATLPLSGIIDTNNWLGRSLFQYDPYIDATYDEFRIYNGLLSDSDVRADYAAGPDVVGVDYTLHVFPSGNSMTVTWGTSVTNLVLQSSPTLGAEAVWNDVTSTPDLRNGRYNITMPLENQAVFYRLHVP